MTLHGPVYILSLTFKKSVSCFSKLIFLIQQGALYWKGKKVKKYVSKTLKNKHLTDIKHLNGNVPISLLFVCNGADKDYLVPGL